VCPRYDSIQPIVLSSSCKKNMSASTVNLSNTHMADVSINVVHIDQRITKWMDTPDNITSLVEYSQQSSHIVEQYKCILRTPIKITFTGQGVREESDSTADKIQVVHDFVNCIYSTLPVHMIDLVQPLIGGSMYNIPLRKQVSVMSQEMRSTCPYCGSDFVIDEDCQHCQHVDLHLRINNSYTDLGRINMARKTQQNAQYREDLCDRTLQEVEGKCTTAIPVHVLVDIITMLLSQHSHVKDHVRIDESFINDIHDHHAYFKSSSGDIHDKLMLYGVISKLPPSYTKYRLTYQINYIYYFLSGTAVKNFQMYRSRLISDMHKFDSMFNMRYPNKHMINIQYFLYEKFKEYQVPDVSIDDFFPLRFTSRKHEYADMYESVRKMG